MAGYDDVLKRRRTVALAKHFPDAEGLSIAQIAERLGRSTRRCQQILLGPTDGQAAGGQGELPGGVPPLLA